MSDDRLERILDAAMVCFARHGVRRTTMDDIAAAAEMSRRSWSWRCGSPARARTPRSCSVPARGCPATWVAAYVRSIRELATATVIDAQDRGEVSLVGVALGDIADLGIALTAGLEADLTEPDVVRRRLRQGVELLVAGLSAPRPAAQRG